MEMKFESLYRMWEDAWKRNALPEGWELAGTFTDWAAANKYKVEYGYKGEFCPENLLKVIPPEERIKKEKPKKERPEEEKPIKKTVKKEAKKVGQNRKIKKG